MCECVFGVRDGARYVGGVVVVTLGRGVVLWERPVLMWEAEIDRMQLYVECGWRIWYAWLQWVVETSSVVVEMRSARHGAWPCSPSPPIPPSGPARVWPVSRNQCL